MLAVLLVLLSLCATPLTEAMSIYQMTPEAFVDAMRRIVLSEAVDGTLALLQRPPGRHPKQELAEASAWYHRLSDEDQAVLKSILVMTAHQAVFGFLAVLDGVRAVEDAPEKGAFRLIFQKGSEESELNPPDGAPLHDILNQEDAPNR